MSTTRLKAISPIVATILLVVVAVVLVTITLSWSRGFTNKGLESSNTILKETSKNYMIGSPKLNAQGIFTFKNITPGDKSITITGYKIISISEDGNFNSIIDLNETTILPGATHIISIPAFPPEDKVTIQLITDQNEYISVGSITNIPEDLQDIPIVLSTENMILSFIILDLNGTINNDLNTISLELPYGTNVTSLTPTITLSEAATVNPLSGASQDFISPVEYTVTAEDLSVRAYTVTIEVEEVPEGIGETPTDGEIWYLEHLAYIDTNTDTRAGTYTLMRNLDFDSDNSYYNAAANKTTWTTGTGWDPIGAQSTLFTGSFDGNNHTISNLYINRPTTNSIGLFGYAYIQSPSYSEIKNVGLEDINIIGQDYVGGLVGDNGGHITQSYSYGNVSGRDGVGGFVGKTWDDTGGYLGAIYNCYSYGHVSGRNYVAGFAGWSIDGPIFNSYSAALVTGNDTGGFLGSWSEANYGDPGYRNYWDINVSGQSFSYGGATGKTTAQMKTQSTFTDWNFSTVWAIQEGTTYPYLINNPQSPLPQ